MFFKKKYVKKDIFFSLYVRLIKIFANSFTINQFPFI